MLCLSRTQRRIRPWLAMVAAYALALQLVLSGLVPGNFHTDNALAANADFAICHSSNDQDGAGKPGAQHDPCMLCTLCQQFSATSPAPQSVSAIDPSSLAVVFDETNDWIFLHRSPTGQYQRGPPTDMTAVG